MTGAGPSSGKHLAVLAVREIGPDDAPTALEVVRAAFSDRPALDPPADALSETVDSLAVLLQRRGGLLAEFRSQDGDVDAVGVLVLDPADDSTSTTYLRRFGVRPGVRGAGVARRLVDAAAEAADPGGAGTGHLAVLAREELPATVAFWRRQGFREVGRRAPYVELRRSLRAVVQPAPTADDLRDIAGGLAGRLAAGDLVVLTGELGAGKTTFTQGLAAGLGVRGAVTSPTFVISRVHPSEIGGPALVHVDAYRLGDHVELDDLDLDASLDSSITVVEWGEGLVEGLADSRIEIRIERAAEAPGGDGLDPRRVEITPVGPRWDGLTRRRLGAPRGLG